MVTRVVSAHLLRLGVCAVLLWAGVDKLFDPLWFARLDIRWIPTSAWGFVGEFLPWAEVSLAGTLAFSKTWRDGARVTAAFLLALTPILIGFVSEGRGGCGCGGVADLPPLLALARNAGLAAGLLWAAGVPNLTFPRQGMLQAERPVN